LTRGQFQQLLYVAVSGLEGAEILAPRDGIRIPPPAVVKPVERWTGKQVISALMGALCPPPLPPLNLEGKTRTPPPALGQENNEHIILFRRGELLMGVMDKSSIGNASLGVVHAVYELYGADFAGKLLNAFGRLFTYHLQNAGHTCGIEDLTLTEKADAERRALLKRVSIEAEHGLANFLDSKEQSAASELNLAFTDKQRKVYEAKLAALSAANRKDTKVRLDGVIQGVINRSASDVIKACLPNGLEQPFLRNNFSIMVLTGAKGSSVNQSQISCFLGQQALEGQRVPVMISGKSLPSFRPFDSSARAGGFVQDRFLTGVKPQEYYFHCMAGREGLVDTAVKTSRSGYLQRCLVKHLEELQVQYDYTVRDSKGNVVQFLYGEDGIDPMASNVLRGANAQMNFMAMNHEGFRYKYGIDADFADLGLEMFRGKELHDLHARAENAVFTNKCWALLQGVISTVTDLVVSAVAKHSIL
jgi:DNA-directed RNA polymerase I subunit RPA1